MEIEFEEEINPQLINMGIVDAFTGKADFTKLGECKDGNIYISRVRHKTRLEVNEEGTRAAAVTSIEMRATSAGPREGIDVILDRPFILYIVDKETNMPLFSGIVNNLK